MPLEFKKNYSSIKSQYRPEIDGLRAFAVITVIINHFNKDILPGGYLGVDIFFVISGFVISSSLYQRPSKDFKDFIIGFYERRIKRLIPALSIFVLITSILISLFNPSPEQTLKTGITSLFGLSNIYLFNQSIDYFAQSTTLNAFTHTWSLGVEEQFYIFFPLLVWFSGFARQTKNGLRNLFLAVSILSIASFFSFIYLYKINTSAAYFLMPARFWEMSFGCLIFLAFKKRAGLEEFLGKVSPLLIMITIIFIMFLPNKWGAFTTISVVILTSILIASLKKQTYLFNVLTKPKVVYLGLISYSLYLWHWSVLSISRWTIGMHWWLIPFQILLMLSLSIASYKYIESPLRQIKWFSKRWKTLTAGIGILFTISSSLFILGKPLKRKIYLGKKSECIPYQYETCKPIDYPHIQTTPFMNGTKIQYKECLAYEGVISDKIMNLCKIKPKIRNTSTFFVVGSSVSAQFSPFFESLRDEFGYGVSFLTHGACQWDPLFRQTNKANTCIQSNKKRTSFILNNAIPGDFIFTGSFSNIDKNSVQKIAEIATSKKINILFFTPIPTWHRLDSGQEFICQRDRVAQWFRPKDTIKCDSTSKINRSNYEKKEDKNLEFLYSLDKSNPFFHTIPIHDYLCNSSTCPSHINGYRLYRDNGNHLALPATKQFISSKLRSFLINKKLIE